MRGQKPRQCLQLRPVDLPLDPAFCVCAMIWIYVWVPFRPVFPAVWGQGLHLLCPLLFARSCAEGLALASLWSLSEKSWYTALGKLGFVSGQEDRRSQTGQVLRSWRKVRFHPDSRL